MRNYTAIPGADLAIDFGREFEAGRISDPAAPSLLRAFSLNAGWTRRQVLKASAILAHAELGPGETRVIPHVTWGPRHDSGQRTETREEKAAAGVKSGIMRRQRTRGRDEAIEAMYRTSTAKQVSKHFSLSIRSIRRIVRWVRESFVNIARRHVAPVTSLLIPRLREWLEASRSTTGRVTRTILNIPVSSQPCLVPGRSSRIVASLMRWCGLKTIQRLPDEAVRDEAERLNAMEQRPLKPKRLAKIAEWVCRERRAFL